MQLSLGGLSFIFFLSNFALGTFKLDGIQAIRLSAWTNSFVETYLSVFVVSIYRRLTWLCMVMHGYAWLCIVKHTSYQVYSGQSIHFV